MKERPILFSAPMVRAILEGRKTQTRRISRKNPEIDRRTGSVAHVFGRYAKDFFAADEYGNKLVCPYGQPGDRLWVRETWRPNPFPTGWPYEYRATAAQDMTPTDGRWKPSIHMPRAASRLLLEIEEVRIERLNDISEEDAIAEGVRAVNVITPYYKQGAFGVEKIQQSHREAFKYLWDLINGCGSWYENKWVWVITFKRIEP